MAALDQALRFLLRPSLPQSCGWQPLRSDQLFEEILLCVILHADWLSRLEGHSCIIFMATKKKLRTIGDSLPLKTWFESNKLSLKVTLLSAPVSSELPFCKTTLLRKQLISPILFVRSKIGKKGIVLHSLGNRKICKSQCFR